MTGLVTLTLVLYTKFSYLYSMQGVLLCNSTIRMEDLALLSISEKPILFSLLEFDFLLLIQGSCIIVFQWSL